MIFCDMDGVLVDFDGFYKQNHGVFPYEIPRPTLWSYVLSQPDYWVNLPEMPDAKELIAYLSKTPFKILTGLPVHGFDKAKIEKTKWIHTHIGPHIEVICCLAKDKQKYGSPGDILIDDRPYVIENWEKMGGIGILHTSATDTIKQLKERR